MSDCCTPETASHLPLYAQLFSVGLLWTSVHCAGMCGPIMIGLTASRGIADERPAARLRKAASGVFAYQGGRAIMYMALGAAAGLAGAVLEAWVHGATRVAGLVLAAVLMGMGLWALPGTPWAAARARMDARSGAATGRWMGQVLRRLDPWLPRQGAARMALVGFALGLLPCMLTFWALGLAASSADPLHGALLMLGLILLTTPVLTAAGCSTVVSQRFRLRAGAAFVPLALLFSGTWVALVSAAANGWIPHVSIPLRLFGQDLSLMLW
ncbi:MAG: sulfite exporter TauE/SafE family protein [Deltaproteobacteria bacterium]|nr:MAG: sulfite exporter TauE/SafE family protein [Deltaproteobacteria bacterium]